MLSTPNGAPPINLNVGTPKLTVSPTAFKLTPQTMLGTNFATGTASGGIQTSIPTYSAAATSAVPVAALGAITPTGTNTTGAIAIPKAANSALTAASPVAAPTPSVQPNIAPTASVGAPAGMMYDGQGNIVPIQPTTQPVTASVPSTSNSSDMEDDGDNSYGGLLKALGDNVSAYSASVANNTAEQQAQAAYIQAVQNQQNYALSLNQGELNQYGIGRPVSLDTGRAAQIGFNNQLETADLTNEATNAQSQETFELGQQQLEEQAGNNALSQYLGIASLAKPEAVSPGQELINPSTGAATSQGNGFQAPTYSDITNLATALFQNGAFPDYSSALQYAQQNFQTIMSGQSSATTGANTTTHPNSTVPMVNGGNVLGYNFDGNSQIGAYAPATKDGTPYSALIAPLVQQVFTAIGATPTASSIQSYISQVAPASPITGSMVMSAATQNGVDARVMMAVMQHESNFGTLGQATTTFNPGNVGNTGSAIANQGSWQTGVNTLAKNLSERYVGNSTDQSQEPQQQTYQALRAILPTPLQGAFGVLSDGTPYFDQSKLNGNDTLAGNYEKQYNISELSSDQIAKAQNIDTLTQSAKQIATILPTALGSGLGGSVEDTASTWLNNFTHTNQGINQLNSYANDAIAAIESINGGSGSGVRISGTEIDLAKNLIPNSTDNLESAQTKLASLQSQINQWRNELFPGTPLATQPVDLGLPTASSSTPSTSGPTQVVYQGQTYNVDAQGDMTLAS